MKARLALDGFKESLNSAYEQVAPRRASSAADPATGPLSALRRWVDALLVVDDNDEHDLDRLLGSHPGASQSSTVAIVSPVAKPGVGKTTTTFVLGNVLASGLRLRVIAVDGAPRSGTLASFAAPEARCERSLEDLVSHAGQVAGIADLRPFVSRLPTGLDLLTQAPDDRRGAQTMTPELYDGLIGLLAIFYEVVLLDVGADVDDPFTRLALDRARRLVVVATPEWVNAGTALDGLRPFPAERTTVVLNKSLPQTAAEHAALEPGFRDQRLHHSVAIPFDGQLQYALHAGAYVLEGLERPSRLAIKRLGLAVAEVLA